ncbi:cupredoxin domain-containing protein [Ramlibacter sp. MMS24-I3-19]|uniref:cupredoxin domain-containing protein n=1 Tax=Ramlibacter sp. MMS24-I3-19 TaxID=3416606 RepID=UPI003D0952C0
MKAPRSAFGASTSRGRHQRPGKAGSAVARAGLFVVALAAAPCAGWAATHDVTIEGMKFEPAEVTVRAGDTVVWHNKDLVPHTATAAGTFDSKEIGPGKQWSWTARKPGRQPYVCTYHPGMQGTVVVQ